MRGFDAFKKKKKKPFYLKGKIKIQDSKSNTSKPKLGPSRAYDVSFKTMMTIFYTNFVNKLLISEQSFTKRDKAGKTKPEIL